VRILSNDYLANVPGSDRVAHGGPANFARNFSAYAIEGGHEWIGLILRTTKGKAMRIQTMVTTPRSRYIGYFLPEAPLERLFKIKKKVDPRIYFATEVARLRRFMQETEPDLLFLNGYSVYSWLLLEAAAREGLPIVIQHAGIACIEYEIYKHLYTDAAREVFLEMERDIVRQVSKQVFLNEYSRQVFSKHVLRVPKDQSIIIPLPYEIKEWDQAARKKPRRIEKREVVIGCVARWDRIKNHAAVLDLARLAHEQGLPWRFESVTTVPQTKLFRQFKDEYQKHITVCAPMDRRALANFYRRMDVLILPSHFDVSPTVVMEAAGAGKPTLISPTVGWVTEYNACKLQKWVVDFMKPDQVIKRLHQLLGQPFPKTFQTFLRRYHAPEKVFQAYLQLFTDVL
jgi:glycosyltransferase involved in cell wall biosynthesis